MTDLTNIKKGDFVKVHLYGTDKKEIKTRNFDKTFEVLEQNGKLGIEWTENEFAAFDTFAIGCGAEIEKINFCVNYEVTYTDMTKHSETIPYDTKEEAEKEIEIFQNDKKPFGENKKDVLIASVERLWEV